MEEKKFITRSARETEEVGRKLSKLVEKGDIIVLTGALGAGKTTFVQGLAKALNVKNRIISPTFVLVRKHRIKLKTQNLKTLYHIDLYRLDSSQDIKNLGLDDIFEDINGIFLIEWGEKHGSLRASWEVNFEILEEQERRIQIIHNE